MFERLYLRLYTSNLERPGRNDADLAWSDAKYTLEMLVGIPLIGFLDAAWIICGDVLSNPNRKFEISAGGQGALFLFVWIAFEVYLRRVTARYKDNPISLEQYRSSAERAKITVALVTSISCVVAEVILVLLVHKRIASGM
jgi:hypothetical protein